MIGKVFGSPPNGKPYSTILAGVLHRLGKGQLGLILQYGKDTVGSPY